MRFQNDGQSLVDFRKEFFACKKVLKLMKCSKMKTNGGSSAQTVWPNNSVASYTRQPDGGVLFE